MKLTNNKILITGATEGIGHELALRFLSLDNLVIVVGRNLEKLNQMHNNDKRVIPFQCDLSKMEEIERLSIFIDIYHNDLNILINNAGIQYNYEFTNEIFLMNKIEHEINVNYLAPIKLTALLLPILKQNENAAIVNVTSGLGLVPKRNAPIYCSTKAGIHIFSKALRYQLNKVKVFEIIPPLVDTNMTTGRGRGKISPKQLVDEFIKAFRNNQFEVSIGKVKLLKIINRISPYIAERIMKKGSEK